MSWLINILAKNELVVHKWVVYAENAIFLGINVMTIGMIDWIGGMKNIFESTPALLLTISMVVLNLAKAFQIMVDALIKKKKELDRLKEEKSKSNE